MSFLINKKINAGALQYTMFISVVIVILISTFLLLTFLQNHLKTIANFRIESIQNSNLGFQYVLEHEIPYDLQQNIELTSRVKSELTLIKKHWGMFDVLKVKSNVNSNKFEKVGLMGGHTKKRPVLYLKDNNNALVLVGNTKIQGNVFLPKNGVKTGNISGYSFYGDQLIYGLISQSDYKLPTIKNRKYLKALSKGEIDENNLIFIDLVEDTKHINSFSSHAQIYKQSGEVHLKNIELIGNIIIQSDSLIKIDNSANLKDILLVAPIIEINNNVTGNFQAIATKNIIVGENCNLLYPSVILLDENKIDTPEKQFTYNNQIQINSNTSIKGIVAFLSTYTTSNFKPQIILENNSKVIGEVYCDKNFELRGIVFGSVYTNNFIALQFGSIYQNHIYNGNILLENLPIQYVGLILEDSKYKISEWLY